MYGLANRRLRTVIIPLFFQHLALMHILGPLLMNLFYKVNFSLVLTTHFGRKKHKHGLLPEKWLMGSESKRIKTYASVCSMDATSVSPIMILTYERDPGF